MPVLEIITYGHPTLHQKAAPVSNINQAIVDLAKDMILTMHEAPGLGLSAPQINVGKRLITLDVSIGKNERDLIILLNPELEEKEGEVAAEEGCLSVPGHYEKIVRPARVVVKGLDIEGREKRIEAEGLLARVFCHEIDHLDGKLFIEHLSPLKRQLLRRRLKKEMEKGGRA